MTRARRAIARVAGLPLAILVVLLLRLSSRRLGVVVLYHGVGDLQGDPDRELAAPHGTALFDGQIGHLRSQYRIVPAQEILSAVRARRRGQRFPAAVTFDDDLGSHAEVALPILRRHGVHATFFLCGASLERPYRFWWERLEDATRRGLEVPALGLRPDPAQALHEVGRRVELMTPEERDAVGAELLDLLGDDPPESGLRASEVRALTDGGMRVGFHTRRHDALPGLDDDRLRAALRDGRAELEAVTGSPVDLIAYPHGRADARVARAAEDAGFGVGFTAAGELVTDVSDPLLLPRLMPYYRSVGQFALQVALQLLSARRGSR